MISIRSIRTSDGKRPLYGAQYFARFTQRLISALTVQTNYGVLYQVDMRLRPSGRSGPLATQIEGFVSYQEARGLDLGAHGADARARGVGAAGISPRGSMRRSATCCAANATPASIAADVVEMRAAIAKEKGDAEPVGPQICRRRAGRYRVHRAISAAHAAPPRLPDILDTSTARMLDKAARLGVLKPEDAEVLRPAVRLFHDLTQILRLCLPAAFDPKTASAGVLGSSRPRRRPAGFSGAGGASRRNAAPGARMFCADFGSEAGLKRPHPHFRSRAPADLPEAASAPPPWCRGRASSGCAFCRRAFQSSDLAMARPRPEP